MSYKINKNKGFTIWELLIVIAIIAILWLMSIPNFRKGGGNPRLKSCRSNMYVINGAIEMYNMDVDEEHQLHGLDDTVFEVLQKDHYLKSIPECPEKKYKGCKYLSKGDILKDGFIYCEYHGTLDGIEIPPDMTISDYRAIKEKKEREEEQKRIEAKRKALLEKLAIYAGILGIIVAIVAAIIESNSKNKKKKAI